MFRGACRHFGSDRPAPAPLLMMAPYFSHPSRPAQRRKTLLRLSGWGSAIHRRMLKLPQYLYIRVCCSRLCLFPKFLAAQSKQEACSAYRNSQYTRVPGRSASVVYYSFSTKKLSSCRQSRLLKLHLGENVVQETCLFGRTRRRTNHTLNIETRA